MAMAVGLGTWATSESVKPCGTVEALRAGSVFHHSSATKASCDGSDHSSHRYYPHPDVACSNHHLAPWREGAGLVNPAALYNEVKYGRLQG